MTIDKIFVGLRPEAPKKTTSSPVVKTYTRNGAVDTLSFGSILVNFVITWSLSVWFNHIIVTGYNNFGVPAT